MYILGISAYYHDSAACLIQDGKILAAAQEERFTRRKHDSRFPKHAVESCLAQAGIALAQVDYIAFYEKPFLKFDRLLETYLTIAPQGLRSFLAAMPSWLKDKLFLKRLLAEELCLLSPGSKRADFSQKIYFSEHHQSHAASCFYPSPYREAAILTLDGVGEWATTSIGHGQENEMRFLQEVHFPHSLGLLYSAFTYYLGFRVNSGEYKVMGLAPYGEPRYVQQIYDELIDVKPDGSFRLNMAYFNYLHQLTMTNGRFHALFGGAPRAPESALENRHLDIARSLQEVTEEVMLRLARTSQRLTGSRHLCLAGGVALNCVGNGRILREGIFDKVWVQPAAGDAGGALGAALALYHQEFQHPRMALPPATPDHMQGACLGPSFSTEMARGVLDHAGARYEEIPSEEQLLSTTVEALAGGKVVGWFQDRMEFGPRALGARSILADPRRPDMQSRMNLKIKFREGFRPFAPAVLRERVKDYFELDEDSPYMMFVTHIVDKLRLPESTKRMSGLEQRKIPHSTLPSITHVDYSARVQTVHRELHPRFHRLLSAFEKNTGCAVLINTSFNVRGEPIVCTPENAYQCFMHTDMDMLVMENLVLYKEAQPAFSPDAERTLFND